MGILLFIVAVLLVIGGIVIAAAPKVIWADQDNGERSSATPPPIKKSGILLSILGIVLFFLSGSIHQIDAGHIGVVRQFGAVTDTVLSPGLGFTIPIVQSVDDVDTTVHSITIADDPNTPQNEAYSAASKEQQDLFMNLTLNYHVDPAKAASIIQNIGSDFEAKIVRPRLFDIPKSVTDDYPTAIVLNSRDEIRQKAEANLRAALEPFGFVVDGINIENFSYSTEYNAAIEAKQVEQQRVETERQKLAQQDIIAQQRVVEAKGLADAQIERARGEAESNRLVSASLTEKILMNRYIEKIAPGVQTILVPSDNGFILNLGDVVKQAAAQQTP